MGEQIQCTGSAIPAVRLVLDPQEVVFDSAEKLLVKGSVDVVEGVECQRHRIVLVADGRFFGSGCACWDYGCCSRIGREDDSCVRKGRIDSGGECEVQVAEGAAAEVDGDGRRVRFQELIHCVERGVRWLPVNWWDAGVFEALDELVDRGGCHGGGEKIINN